MSVASALDPLRAANRMAVNPRYSWTISTQNGEPAELTCGVSLPSQARFKDIPRADMLVIIGGFHSPAQFGADTLATLGRVAPQHRLVGGVEAGSWFMARAGLLNGRKATTHWEDLEDFEATFPQVAVVASRYVLDGNRFTTGGASPTFDLMLALTRARYGAPLAMDVASAFIYDEVRRADDEQPTISFGRLEQTDPSVAEAIRLMGKQVDEPLSLDEVARRVGLSLRSLEARFANRIGMSPGRYYRQLRLQAARKLVTDTALSMREISMRTGFASLSAFSRCFAREYGASPSSLRQKF